MELLLEQNSSEAKMYDHVHPASLGTRDVIAAWLVCLAITVAVFVYPGFLPEPAREAQAALSNAAPAGLQIELCAIPGKRIAEPHS